MSTQEIVGLFFAATTITYWILQLTTGFFARRYFLHIAILVASGVLGIWYIVLATESGSRASLLSGLVAAAVAVLAIAALGLGFAKLFLLTGDRMRSIGSLERSLVRLRSPALEFDLTTDDGVRIRVEHLRADPPRRDAVIVCHGGGRNKDVYVYAATCELLFEDYDVLTFDLRGHGQSGGRWTGDGKTKYDLKAVIDYARADGYQKIGLVGRSFGAWTAIIEVAEYRNADTIVAAAPPPTDMREIKLTRPLFAWGYKPWAFPFRAALAVVRGVRIARYADHPSLMDHVGRVAPVPLFIVCNEYDRAIGMPEERFRELYDRAGEPKRIAVLKGTGHVADWPNTYYYWQLVRDWLAQTLEPGQERS